MRGNCALQVTRKSRFLLRRLAANKKKKKKGKKVLDCRVRYCARDKTSLKPRRSLTDQLQIYYPIPRRIIKRRNVENVAQKVKELRYLGDS